MLCLWLNFEACRPKAPKPVERQQQIVRYLQQVQGVAEASQSSYAVVVFETGFCGACHRDFLAFIRQHINPAKHTYIVMQEYKQEVADEFGSLPNVELLTDKNFALEKYGLIYVKSTVFVVSEGNVIYWSFITDAKFNEIAGQLKSLS